MLIITPAGAAGWLRSVTLICAQRGGDTPLLRPTEHRDTSPQPETQMPVHDKQVRENDAEPAAKRHRSDAAAVECPADLSDTNEVAPMMDRMLAPTAAAATEPQPGDGVLLAPTAAAATEPQPDDGAMLSTARAAADSQSDVS